MSVGAAIGCAAKPAKSQPRTSLAATLQRANGGVRLNPWWACAVALGVLAFAACSSNTPTLPGEFIGTFLFNGTLAEAGEGTTCVVDGGNLFLPTTIQFYVQVALLPDAGVLWALQDGPLNPSPVLGTAADGGMTVATNTLSLLSGCSCTAKLAETVVLLASGDAGLQPGLASLTGTLDDRLDPDLDPDAGTVCMASEGLGCGIGCDLLYDVVGVPGSP